MYVGFIVRKTSSKKSANKWFWGIACIAAIVFVRSLSDEENDRSGKDAPDLPSTEIAKNAEPNSPAPKANDATVHRAALHAGKVYGALGSDGVKNYSEFCYEALAANFTAEHRDRCYAFDLLAARLIIGDDHALPYRLQDWSIRSRWQAAAESYADAAAERSEVEEIAGDVNVDIILPPKRIELELPPGFAENALNVVEPLDEPVTQEWTGTNSTESPVY